MELVPWINRLIPHLQAPLSPVGAGSSPGCSISHPAYCFWPGKAAGTSSSSWIPAPI